MTFCPLVHKNSLVKVFHYVDIEIVRIQKLYLLN